MNPLLKYVPPVDEGAEARLHLAPRTSTRCEVAERDGCAVITVHGEVDLASKDLVWDAIAQALERRERMVVDLSLVVRSPRDPVQAPSDHGVDELVEIEESEAADPALPEGSAPRA